MKNTIYLTLNPYDDEISRLAAMQILKEYNPKLNSATSIVDIDCKEFYVDVKRIYRNANDFTCAGINKEAYDKYIKLDKVVYILFMFNDYYSLINCKSEHRTWNGLVNDRAKGVITRTIYNYDLTKSEQLQYYFQIT